MTVEKFYVAGPMQGYPNFNFPAFARAVDLLRVEGHFVFSPAERDLERDASAVQSATGSIAEAESKGFNLREALQDDTGFIAEHATAIAFLPGWEHSSGALAEWALAKALKLKFRYITEYELKWGELNQWP